MRTLHKQTVTYFGAEDFYNRDQTTPNDYRREDLNTPDKREAFQQAAVVILQFNGHNHVMKSKI